MTQEKKLYAFVNDVLNFGGKRANAICYDGNIYDGSRDVRVNFNRNHREQYNILLRFCADNKMIVISTHPATLETVVRVSTKEEV